jgi:hypothetical protein
LSTAYILPFAALAFFAVVSMIPDFFLFQAASAMVELVWMGRALTNIAANRATAQKIVDWRRKSWRREWDSNPRYGFPHTRFPSVRLKPLGHLSEGPSLEGARGLLQVIGAPAPLISTTCWKH